PGRVAPDPGDDPRGQADRGTPRPGGAGPLELDPPVVRGPGARRRLRPRLRRGGAPDRGRLGQLLALRRAGPVRRAARVPVHAVPARAGAGAALPAAGRRARAVPGPDLRVPRRGAARADRDTAAERDLPPGTDPRAPCG